MIESASDPLALVLRASGAGDEAIARYQDRARSVVQRRSIVPGP